MSELTNKINRLYSAWIDGKLGGEVMPEDSNPNLAKDSEENLLFFTLPMALNYQRNSYTLWESAYKTYQDDETKDVFDIKKVLNMSDDELREKLVKYRVALQHNKQVQIWRNLCETINNRFDGKISNLFKECNYDCAKIKEFMQKKHKKEFPYLSGNKLCNYWLHVVLQYTNFKLNNRAAINVAADSHVVKATVKLGLITGDESDLQIACINAWNKALEKTDLLPIDIHTALWLWSRNGFIEV